MRKEVRRSLLVALFLVAAGCSDNSFVNPSVTTASPGLPSLDRVPEAQRKALADGKVTLDEYRKGFDAFAACLVRRGVPAGSITVDPRTGIIDYGVHERVGTPAQPTNNSTGQCYDETFSYIEYVYQTTDPLVLQAGLDEEQALYDSKARACLARNGVEAGADEHVGTETFVALMNRWREFDQAGKC